MTTANELLDEILIWYAYSSNAKPNASVERVTIDFHERHNKGQSMEFIGNLAFDLSKVVRKLEKDGYIELTGMEIESKQNCYTVTFDGLIFIQDRGYVVQQRRKRQDTYFLKLTSFFVAFGTVGVLIIEILKDWHWIGSINFFVLIVIFLFGIIAGLIIHKIVSKDESKYD